MPSSAERPSVPWWQVILIGRNPRFTLVRLVVLVTICYLIPRYVLLPIRVSGISMLPNYPDKGIRLVNRLAYRSHLPQRGDVVAIRMSGERVMLLKRVIGLPGETLAFQRGQLLINGEPVSEPYVKLPCNWTVDPIPIWPGYYYVVGDNRTMAPGDHTQGRAALSQIVGKAL